MQPYHPSSAGPVPPGRRLLLLSHHFPPSQAAGALRWQKLIGFAGEYGWGVDVITLDPTTLRRADWERLAEIPAGTRVFGVARPRLLLERLERVAVQAYRRITSWGLGQRKTGAASGPATGTGVEPVIVPREQIRWRPTVPRDYLRAYDAWMYFARDAAWNGPAIATALRVFQPGTHATVITSGPPHTVHRAGWEVARRARIPFVMDMRDPWGLARAVSDHMASPVWLRIAAQQERAAVERAALVVTNTEPMRRAMQEAFPQARERVIAILNGYDEETVPVVPLGGRFTIAYAGSIYLDRDPRPLFRAAARVVREAGLTPEQFGIDMIGHVERFGGTSVAALAREAGIAAYVRLGPPRPRREMMEFLAASPVLLSLPQDLPLAIPSKVFEYMQFAAWLLVLARRDSATELLLRGTTADVVEPADEGRLAAVLGERYRQFARGERPVPLAADGRFSRRAQAGLLFDALERCLGTRP